jgi:transcriptional regulator with XRE-family HTH domain
MEKTEMMKRFEKKTDCYAIDTQTKDVTRAYISWLESKAEAYDRLMSGGKKTLKEWANIFGMPVAVDAEGRLLWFPKKPEIGLVTWIWYDEQFGVLGEELPRDLIDFNGDWKDSLTLPDGWEDK